MSLNPLLKYKNKCSPCHLNRTPEVIYAISGVLFHLLTLMGLALLNAKKKKKRKATLRLTKCAIQAPVAGKVVDTEVGH